jgi:UDP-N-acetylmuramyl-tripeptide synthetase
MEVSAHALHYKKVLGIDFCACIFTNFTQDHLDFFKTMQAYKKAKTRLFSSETCPLAIVNGDDETGEEIIDKRKENPQSKTVVYGLDLPADTFALITHEGLYSNEIILNLCDELCRVSLSIVGRHNIYNALAAATCAYALGVPVLSISAGLNSFGGVSGRLQFIGDFKGADIFVDFAHTPDGLEKSLSVLKKHCKGRLICLFGCGGNRDKGKRPIMGETAAKKSDFCVLTSDNPRYEDPLDILADIEKGYRRFSLKYVIVPDRKHAISYALDYVKAGDILLVAGKGGETTQEIMGIKYPFNDNAIIEKTIREKRKNLLFE